MQRRCFFSAHRGGIRAFVWLIACVATMAGCGPREASVVAAAPAASAAVTSFYASPFERRPNAAELTELGRALFSDATLSASGQMACVSCHDPAHAYGPPNDLPVQRGGPDLTRP